MEQLAVRVVVDVCRVVTGAPIVLSEPHFYQADATYQRDIDGLSPNDSCLTFLDVEPVSNNRQTDRQTDRQLSQLHCLSQSV